ncbi:hypothetical protein ACUNFG_16305 [Serratia sp. IR-2025]
MNKVMNLIANKIIGILRGRPALKVGNVSVWGSFTTDEKERLRQLLLDSQIARVEDQKLEERIAELEKRLATPVRLPNKSDDEFWFDGVFQVAKFDRAVERAISAAGFKFVGDE